MAVVFVRALVVNRHGQLLLLTRSLADEHRPGDADLPGGGVDEGEDLGAAMVREIQEETGLVVRLESLRLVYAATSEDEGAAWPKTRALFVADTTNDSVQLSEEHTAYAWVSYEEAYAKLVHTSWGEGIRLARKYSSPVR